LRTLRAHRQRKRRRLRPRLPPLHRHGEVGVGVAVRAVLLARRPPPHGRPVQASRARRIQLRRAMRRGRAVGN
ncbi:hypothetical protein OC842_008034, partial [Tilletia horrida]